MSGSCSSSSEDAPPTHTHTPKCAAVFSKPGSALNHLQSSFKSMFPEPHSGEPGRSGWDWEAGLQLVLVLRRLRKAWPLGEPRLPVQVCPVWTRASLQILLTLRALESLLLPFPRQERLPFLDYKVSLHSSLNICHKRQLLYGPLLNSRGDSLRLSLKQMFIEGHYMPSTVITKIIYLPCLWVWVGRQMHTHNTFKNFYFIVILFIFSPGYKNNAPIIIKHYKNI